MRRSGTRLRLVAWGAVLLAAGCERSSVEPEGLHVANRPPSAKDVIEAVLASHATSLEVSPTCTNAGTELTDATIGRYLAGFMAEMQTPDNRIETSTENGVSARGEPVWVASLTLRHANGDDVWGWGVRFHVRQSDGLVLPDSFECTGAG